MIYAIFFKRIVEEKEETEERIHSQFIEYIPRKYEGIEILGETYIIKDVSYVISEVETLVQILLEEMKDQC